MQDFFDRKTFDPINNPEHESILAHLRTMGSHRLVLASGNRWTREEAQSTAMRWLNLKKQSGIFIDLGCGNSGDCTVAAKLGFTAYGYDLFPPGYDKALPYFTQADVVERISLEDNSVDVAVSQAMLDLIEPVAREHFFREVDRVLKPGGVFSCYIQWLQSGWGFDLQEEQDRARKVWPNLQTKPQGFIATKEISNE